MTHIHRILLIDSYDSFSFNLKTLVENVTGALVTPIHNDALTTDQLLDILPNFDAVVVGPGPGSPADPADVGVLPALWNLDDQHILPVFGVCLGFQSLCLAFGGNVRQLKLIKHGQTGLIQHNGAHLFEGLSQPFDSVRYHSLHGVLPENPTASDIEPLAWVHDEGNEILMAGKHKTKPFYGVQYHPESICSEHGDTVVRNFWRIAQEWSKQNSRVTSIDQDKLDHFIKHYSIKPDPLASLSKAAGDITPEVPAATFFHQQVKLSRDDYAQIAVDICDSLHSNRQNKFVLLNSAAKPGRYSVIGLVESGKTTIITHYTTYKADKVFVKTWDVSGSAVNHREDPIDLDDSGIWGYLSRYMRPKIKSFSILRQLQHSSEQSELPGFCGGLIGYFSYEEGDPEHVKFLKDITPADMPYPDTNLVDIDRSIVIDNLTGICHVMSLREEDAEWVQKTVEKVKAIDNSKVDTSASIPSSCSVYFGNKSPVVQLPDKDDYLNKISKAKQWLQTGHSYELCLTAQTTISVPQTLDPWNLYKVLMKRNPSPYSCFLDLQDTTLVGSSPERFMSWDNQGVCEFRPIKGTVKKNELMTATKATAILNTPKERAENLMIVDLIRHDLNQVLSNVRVSKLMGVEEYETLYQLVSVIRGDLTNGYSGIDVLAHSLPPGSMTGAPKIRSVELLHELEDLNRRGIYSGVCGYWSIMDEGDWSVIIRSAFKYNDEGGEQQIWRIGAGGAITILSDAQEEWKEMEVKLESALQAFL